GEVACHSVMSPRTDGLVDRLATYNQTPGPNGVRHDATSDAMRTTPVRRDDGRRATTSWNQATPTRAGPNTKLPWRFAHIATRTGTSQSRRGDRSRSMISKETAANRTMPSSCGRRPSATSETANEASVNQAAVRRSAPSARHERWTIQKI